MLTREDLKQQVSDMFQSKFGVNLMEVDEEAPLEDLQKLNEKLDSLQVLEFLFDVEDEMKFKFGDSDAPKTLKDIFDSIYAGYLNSVK
jgi:acyl carrier protein